MSHPLLGVGLRISYFKSFGAGSAGFDSIQPINIIIGRNNTGKSALIDAIELCIAKGTNFDPGKHGRSNKHPTLSVSQDLDEASLRKIFKPKTAGGGVPGGDHWAHFGSNFVGKQLRRELAAPSWQPKYIDGPDLGAIAPPNRQTYYDQLASHTVWPFEGLQLIRVAAERNIRPEGRSMTLELSPNGEGTTNLIRAFINSDALPSEEVERGLLDDLNTIYRGDCQFTKIICQEDDGGTWELFLREENKGNIRLSQSGSSLKSVFIVLSLLRLVPFIKKTQLVWARVILAIEEPENNLHPALLRRLMNFLADQRTAKHFTLNHRNALTDCDRLVSQTA